MSQFLFVDDQKRMAIPEWRYVADEGTLTNIEEYLCLEMGISSLSEIEGMPAESQLWAKPMLDALACVRQLPKITEKQLAFDWSLSYKNNNPLFGQGIYAVVSAPAFGQEERVATSDISEQTARQSWSNIDAAKKSILVLHKFLGDKKDDDKLSLTTQPLTRAINLRKMLGAGTVVIKDKNIDDSFIDLMCCAIYVNYKDRNGVHIEGFLDARDGVSPLHRARLFDSEKSVEAFLKRSTVGKIFPSLQVVHINLGIDRLGPLHQNAGSYLYRAPDHQDTKLREAIAVQDNRKITEALRNASRQNLLDALEKLDQNSYSDHTPGISPTKKRM